MLEQVADLRVGARYGIMRFAFSSVSLTLIAAVKIFDLVAALWRSTKCLSGERLGMVRIH